MAMTTTANVAGFLPNFYSKTFLERLTANPIMMQYAIKKPLPQGTGKVVYFPRMVNSSRQVSAYKITEGTTITPELIDDIQLSATVEQFANAKGIGDLTLATAIDTTVEETIKELADQAADIIDTRIIEEAYGTSASSLHGINFSTFAVNLASSADLGSSTSAFYTYVGTAEYRIGATTLRQASKKLKARNVKPLEDGFFVLVCHSDTAMQLQADQGWKDAYQYTDAENMRKGVAGVYSGIKVQIDNNIKTSAYGSAGATLYHSILLGKGAMGVTMLDGGVKTYYKPAGSAGTQDPVDQENTWGYKVTFVPKTLNISCGLIVVSADA